MSQTNHVKRVAVVGATGTVGKYIVEELLKKGKHEVTAITREDSKSKIPEALKVARVNYDDQSTLVGALQGQDALIISLAVRAPKDTQLKLVEAAAEANVPFVLPNYWCPDFGANEQLGNDVFASLAEGAVRKRIEELGKSSWMGLISSFWYESSLALSSDTYGMDYKKRTFTFFDDGETKINTTTMPQSGKAVAGLLSLPIESASEPCLSQFRNKYVYVSSFCVSQKDMFESVLRVSGTAARDWTIEHEGSAQRYAEGRERMQGGDRAGFTKLLYSRVFYKDGSGNYEASKGLDNDALGLEKENIDDFTRIAIDKAEVGLTYP